jgi:hypothetical protein
MPQPSSDSKLDPQQLFEFLGTHEAYPISGFHLAQEARQSGASDELIRFFEAIPGTLNSHSEVVAHAIKPTEPPYGKTLDLTKTPGDAQPPDISDETATLQITDITQE